MGGLGKAVHQPRGERSQSRWSAKRLPWTETAGSVINFKHLSERRARGSKKSPASRLWVGGYVGWLGTNKKALLFRHISMPRRAEKSRLRANAELLFLPAVGQLLNKLGSLDQEPILPEFYTL